MLLDEYAQTELLATFQVELAEHSQALTRAFLALEKEPETAERQRLLAAALRSAHNLKGASRAVALSAVEMLAHQMEGVLGAATRDDVELSPALFDLLFAAVDNLSTAATSDAASDDATDRLEELHARLAAAQTGDVQPLTAIEPLAAALRCSTRAGCRPAPSAGQGRRRGDRCRGDDSAASRQPGCAPGTTGRAGHPAARAASRVD